MIDIIVQLTDKNAESGLKKLAGVAEGSKSKIMGLKSELMAIGAGVGVAGLGIKLAKEALTWNTSVKKMQNVTGAAAEQASELMAIANYMGFSVDDTAGAFAKFSRVVSNSKDSMEMARVEGKLSTDILSRLGFTLEDIKGKNAIDTFKLVSDRLKQMQNGSEKTRVEMELFGRSGYKLHGLLNMTAEQMEAVAQRARDLGMVIDDETAEKSAKLNRQLSQLEQTSKRLAISVGQEVLPIFTEYAKAGIEIVEQYSQLDKETREAMGSVLKFGVEVGIATTVIRSVTAALGFMRLATIAAAGPWVALAAAIGLATKGWIDYQWAKNTQGQETGVTLDDGRVVYKRTTPLEGDAADKYSSKYWTDKLEYGVFHNSKSLNKAEEAMVDAKFAQLEAEKKRKEDSEKALADAQAKIDEMNNGGLTNNALLNKMAEEQKKAAEEQKKAAEKQRQAAERLANAVERINQLYDSLNTQLVELTGSTYQADLMRAQNQRDSVLMQLQEIIKSAKGKSIAGETDEAGGVYTAANNQIGKPYELGADGTWATDCGKLFADAVRETFNKDIPRYVPSIIDAAREAGAWHDAGDGYAPKAGDGVVVLGDNHIVIADGVGGYTGANSSTGVVHKDNIEGDFGPITGYVDTSALVGRGGASASTVDYSGLNAVAAEASALADSEMANKVRAKNEELYQARLEEAERAQAIRTRKMNESIIQLDNERLGNRLEVLKAEQEAQIAAIHDNVRQYTKDVDNKELAEKRANAEILKLQAETDNKIRELRATELNEFLEHSQNLISLNQSTQLAIDQENLKGLEAYKEYAQKQLDTAQLTVEQRLQVEKHLVENQQRMWEIAGRNIRTSLAEGVRQYNQEIVNYADLAKSTFDNTLSSVNNAFTTHFENMDTGAESFGDALINTFKDITNSIIKMLINISFQQYLQPKITSLFGGIVNGIGGTSVSVPSYTDTFGSSLYDGGSLSNVKGWASGGITDSGIIKVGEHGPELLQVNGNNRIYTAQESKRLISERGSQNVYVNIVNQSGTKLDSKQQNTRFDGENMIIDVIVNAMTTNKGGVRDAVRAAAV